MIKDNNQLAYTKELASKFEDANRKLKVNQEKQHLEEDGWQLIQDSNEALRQKLISEIEEYEFRCRTPNCSRKIWRKDSC